MLIAPGTRLGAYELVALIGRGGMGDINRARDIRLGRDVAIKVLPSDVAADRDRLTRFEREAHADRQASRLLRKAEIASAGAASERHSSRRT